jgi:putative ABC transport system ATP-binding protein
MSIIHLQNILFQYPGQPKPVLQIENFEMKKNERIFLHGPSGSGKTTLLEILAGVLRAQSGRCQVLERDLHAMTPLQRDDFRACHLGYIFQQFNLIPYLTVQENIELPCRLSRQRRERLGPKKIEDESRVLAQRLGIGPELGRAATALSVGQQQRVAVARALLGHPELVLADEPTSSLDTEHREQFLKLLFEVCDAQGTAVLFVSHDRSIEPLFSRAVSLPQLNSATVGGLR